MFSFMRKKTLIEFTTAVRRLGGRKTAHMFYWLLDWRQEKHFLPLSPPGSFHSDDSRCAPPLKVRPTTAPVDC